MGPKKLLQDPSTEQRYQMEPPEQGQNYSVNIPLTTDVSHLHENLKFSTPILTTDVSHLHEKS